MPASVNERYVIRFCVVTQNCTEEDIGNTFEFLNLKKENNELCKIWLFLDYAWEVIVEFATELLEKVSNIFSNFWFDSKGLLYFSEFRN